MRIKKKKASINLKRTPFPFAVKNRKRGSHAIGKLLHFCALVASIGVCLLFLGCIRPNSIDYEGKHLIIYGGRNCFYCCTQLNENKGYSTQTQLGLQKYVLLKRPDI